MNIGIDLDNVLADFQTTWLEFHNKHYGTELVSEDTKIHEFNLIAGIPREEFVKRVYEFYESGEFDDIEPEPGAEKAIPLLSEEHRLYIVTSRPDSTIPRTQEWIKRYFDGHFEKILHSNQFSINPKKNVTKASLCKDYAIPLLIEDAPNYAEETADAGITVLLLDQPWNREMKEGERIIRVKDWNETVEEIGEISGEQE